MGQSTQPSHANSATPVHLAIAAHHIAWEGLRVSEAFLDASGQEYRKKLMWPAKEAEGEAAGDLLYTACGTRDGAEALVAHLQWYLAPRPGLSEHFEPSFADDLRARTADLLVLLGKKAPSSSSPIRAAIAEHRAAWEALWAAPPKEEGWDEAWWSVLCEARGRTGALLEVPCGNRAGARVLLKHLRVFLAELAEASEEVQDGGSFYQSATEARLADLAMLLDAEASTARHAA
jgi:hypothetical protein